MKTTKRDRILQATAAAKEDLRQEREATKALRGQVAYLTDQIEVERRNAERDLKELRAQVAALDVTVEQQQQDLAALAAATPEPAAALTSTCGMGTPSGPPCVGQEAVAIAVAPTFPEKPLTAPTPEEVSS